MGDGPPRFPRGSTCPEVLRYSLRPLRLRVRGYYPLWPTFPGCSSSSTSDVVNPTTPPRYRDGLGCSRFAHHYSGNRVSFSSCRYLDVSVPHVRHLRLCIQRRLTGHDPCRVSPFGHLRIIARSQLPEAFRSVPRPSSPPDAKASTESPL